MRNGKQFTIDEKARFKDYGDILLEIWSNEQYKTHGWATKDLMCDYIAYGIIPSQRCYLLPVNQLQNALRRNWKKWYLNNHKHRAQNTNHVTVNVAVNTQELLREINNTLIININEAA